MKFPTLILTVLTFGCAAPQAQLSASSPAEGYAIETTGNNNQILSLTSPVYEMNAGKEEIISRAQACAGRTFSFGDVKATGSNAALLGTDQQSITFGGGQLIEMSDPARGVLVANNRVNYSRAIVPYSAQAKINVEAKDGRFRVVMANPEVLQRSTGYASTGEFRPMMKIWGTGWDAGVSHLADSANKLVDCIKSPGEKW